MASARPSTSSASRPERSSRSSCGEERKSSGGSHRVCRYCFQGYCERENRKGSCAEAPDRSVAYVELLSCVTCARICAYHCFADDDGDYEHPCAPYAPASTRAGPEAPDPGSRHSRDSYGPLTHSPPPEDDDAPARGAASWRKWTLLSLLALCVPCLCLYFPLRACHRWALRHHYAGGRHEAVMSAPGARAKARLSAAAAQRVQEEEEEEDSGCVEVEGDSVKESKA